jgi:transcriptional regulator
MYIPNAFRIADRQTALRLIARYDFATLVSHADEGFFATHLPFMLEQSGERELLCAHMARANPHWHHFDGTREAIVIFQGPHAYISPSWYASSPAVPTWNYAVVHVHGRPRIVEARTRVASILERLVARHESPMCQPWSTSAVSAEYLERMTNAIVAFEIDIDRVEAKFKLSQNRSEEDVEGVIRGLTSEGGQEGSALAEFTRDARARSGG